MGKKKGSAYERKIASKMSYWWCGENKHLWRADMAASGISEFPGDVARTGKCRCDHTPFPFTVECKFQKDTWKFKNLLNPKNINYLLKWWDKIERKTRLLNEEDQSGYIPTLVFTKNHHPDYIMLNQEGFDLVDSDLFLEWNKGDRKLFLTRLDQLIDTDSKIIQENYVGRN